jgi:hypothetical protein
MLQDPAEARLLEDLAESAFVAGCDAGRWRIESLSFPWLRFAVSAVEPGGTSSEYGFLAELSNYPAQAPHARIWDLALNQPLAVVARPKAGHRVAISFQNWTEDTVYRAWERKTGPHISNAAAQPHLAWWPDRRFSFICEDLHGLLNLNTRALALRKSA